MGRLGEFERFRFIGSPIAVGHYCCSLRGEGGGVGAQEVKLDGTTGRLQWERGREGGEITSAPRSALEHSAATFSSVDSLIVRIVHAGLSDARSSGGRKRRACHEREGASPFLFPLKDE